MWYKILAVARKETYHILRDARTLGIVLVLPLVLLTIFGFAISFEVKNQTTLMLDYDNSSESRELIRQLTSSGYFINSGSARNYRQIRQYLDQGKVKAALVIPKDFSRRLEKGEAAPVQFLVDGSDPNAANISLGYFAAISNRYALEKMVNRSRQLGKFLPDKSLAELRLRILYNSELKTANFIVPGLIAIIMMMVGTVLTAVSVVREKERGTIQGILASPLTSREFILGKLLPYLVIAFLDLFLIILAGFLVFQVPVRGVIFLLLFLSFFFLASVLGIGLLISTVTTSQQTAMMLSFFATVLPAFLLSGFVFPIRSMPWFLQAISFIVPARYYLTILRGILLKGVGLSSLYPQFIALLVLSSLILGISMIRLSRET